MRSVPRRALRSAPRMENPLAKVIFCLSRAANADWSRGAAPHDDTARSATRYMERHDEDQARSLQRRREHREENPCIGFLCVLCVSACSAFIFAFRKCPEMPENVPPQK